MDSASVTHEGGAAGSPGATLLVASEGVLRSYALVPGETLMIGRSRDVEVRVDDEGVSRHHARVTLGPPLQLEEFYGCNGIRYRGRKLAEREVVPLAMDEVVELGFGRTLIVVREGGVLSAPLAGNAMAAVREVVDRVAATEMPLLFVGETGTGKQGLAEAAHRASPRRGGPFVRVDAARLSDERYEAEVMGVPGGPPGLLAQAAGGTVFLDDVAELSLDAQARLMRWMEPLRRTAADVGAADVRWMAATCRSLRVEVNAGRFRRDLRDRLNGVAIHLPPLRDRRGALHALADELLARACAGRDLSRWSPGALAALATHAWPGNVHELGHAIDRAVAAHRGGVLEAADLRLDAPPAETAELRELRDELERDRISHALAQYVHKLLRVARLLDLSQDELIDRMRRHGLLSRYHTRDPEPG